MLLLHLGIGSHGDNWTRLFGSHKPCHNGQWLLTDHYFKCCIRFPVKKSKSSIVAYFVINLPLILLLLSQRISQLHANPFGVGFLVLLFLSSPPGFTPSRAAFWFTYFKTVTFTRLTECSSVTICCKLLFINGSHWLISWKSSLGFESTHKKKAKMKSNKITWCKKATIPG